MTKDGQYIITDQADAIEWQSFVCNHPCGTIFQSYELFCLYKETTSYEPATIFLRDKNAAVIGILFYNIIRDTGLKGAFSARSIISGGPLVRDNNPLYCSLLINEYLRRIRKLHIIYTQIRNMWQYPQLNEALLQTKFRYSDHLTFITDLTQTEAQLEARLHKMRQSNIRRVKKKKMVVTVASAEDFVEINDLIRKTYNRINIPGPPRDLLLSLKNHLPENNVAFVIRHNNNIIGCRIYLLYKETMYDWYAGSDLNFTGLHPNDLLPWEAFLWGKRNGFTRYDFGGAGNPKVSYGVREYKKKFGGEQVNVGRYIFIHKHYLFQIGRLIIWIKKLI